MHGNVGKTGKPAMLRGTLSGYLSRRITKADRIVYQTNGDKVIVSIVSMKGYYGDK